MKSPPHPGEHVRHDCLKPLGFSVTEATEKLGVMRQTLNNLVNGRAGVSPEMATRLSKAFGGSPRLRLALQMNYDLAQALKRAHRIRVSRLHPAA